MNGSGAIVPATMTHPTPECDVIAGLPTVDSCTTYVLTSTQDASDSQVNTDVRNSEFVHVAGGNQCDYARWKTPRSRPRSSRSWPRAAGSAATAPANPYDRGVSFTTGMFNRPDYGATIDDSHFVTRDRGVGIEEGGSLFVDSSGLATLSGQDAYVVLGDHQPEQAVAGKPLTFSNFKIWHLTPGSTYHFANRPTCGYCTRSVLNGVPDSRLYDGAPGC